MITCSTILKPLLKLSIDDFPNNAKHQFGDLPEMEVVWPHFKPPSHAIVDNFWRTIDNPKLEALIPALNANPTAVRGVAYEGAAMGLMLLDFVLPYKKRVRELLEATRGRYTPMVYVGAGMMLPRLPVDPLKVIAQYDDASRWMMLDGYGFYKGFFDSRDSLDRQYRPDGLDPEAARNFDSGLGRSLYFLSGANPERIAAVIQRFPPVRRPDLWGGIGLACGYTGGVLDRNGVIRLLDAAGIDAAEVAVGVAVAAGFREQTKHPAAHTDAACEAVWGVDSAEVARLAATQSSGTQPDPSGPRYAAWRRNVRTMWLDHPSAPSSLRGLFYDRIG